MNRCSDGDYTGVALEREFLDSDFVFIGRHSCEVTGLDIPGSIKLPYGPEDIFCRTREG